MIQKYVIVFTGIEDPMWPFLSKGCSEDEKKALHLFTTDRPDLCTLQYNTFTKEVTFRIQDEVIKGSEVIGIWWRRLVTPDLAHFGKELSDYCINEYNFFYEGLEYLLPDVTWVSLPSQINRAQSKPRQLIIAKELGFVTLDTFFTNAPATFSGITKITDYIYKAVRYPRVPLNKDKIKTVFTTRLEPKHLQMAERILSCPCILQMFCQKKADIRVTVFGESVFPVIIYSQAKDHSQVDFRIGAKLLDHQPYQLPLEVENQCRQLVKQLGLLYGAIDLALLEDGSYIFFEINPNGQWGWLEQKCNLPMRRALLDILFKKGKS